MTEHDLQRARALLIKHEGRRARVYDDATGKDLARGAVLVGLPTIGVGRNLLGKGLTPAEQDFLLDNDIAEALGGLTAAFPWFSACTPARQLALVDFAFNEGIAGLHRSPKMLAALASRDYATAAAELVDGPWARQVGPTRSGDLQALILRGDFS